MKISGWITSLHYIVELNIFGCPLADHNHIAEYWHFVNFLRMAWHLFRVFLKRAAYSWRFLKRAAPEFPADGQLMINVMKPKCRMKSHVGFLSHGGCYIHHGCFNTKSCPWLDDGVFPWQNGKLPQKFPPGSAKHCLGRGWCLQGWSLPVYHA